MQLHNRMGLNQIKLVLGWYIDGKIDLGEALLKLNIKRRRFFNLLKMHREGRLESLGKKTNQAVNRIPKSVEDGIRKELEKEQKIICNKDIPVDRYNYSCVRDEVIKKVGLTVSYETVRKRALEWGFWIKRHKSEKKHTRIILTDKVGTILQHDSSHHLSAPHGSVKWYLITTLDDFSRKILCAKFLVEETAWEHIKACEFVCKTYGIPANYYVDNHSIFRFTERMESYWRTPKVKASEVLTTWEACLKALGIGVFHALSPQAKGKIERPYRWLQDRVVRRCAKEEVIDITKGQEILDDEVYRYNAKTVHSTTGEIPDIRFARAVRERNSVFRKFQIPPPFRTVEDIFCIREPRKVSGYQSVSWRNRPIKVPAYIPIGDEVILHIVPDNEKPQIRIWYKEELVDVLLLAPTNREYVTQILKEDEDKKAPKT